MKYNTHQIISEYKWKVIEEIGLFFERRLNITEVQDSVKQLFAELEEELKSEVNSLEIKDIRQMESLSELGENPNANIHSQINNEIGKDYDKNGNKYPFEDKAIGLNDLIHRPKYVRNPVEVKE